MQTALWVRQVIGDWKLKAKYYKLLPHFDGNHMVKLQKVVWSLFCCDGFGGKHVDWIVFVSCNYTFLIEAADPYKSSLW